MSLESVLQTALPTGFSAELFLEIGVLLLSLSVTVLVTVWTAHLSGNATIGIGAGMSVVVVLYSGVRVLQIPLLMAAPAAVVSTALAVVAASFIANIEISTADL